MTLGSDHMPNYFVRYITQIFLFLVLATLILNYREAKFLKNVFIIATAIYVAMTIYSRIQAGSARYIPSPILLFIQKLFKNRIFHRMNLWWSSINCYKASN